MRTMFEASPFSKFDLGSYAPPAHAAGPSIRAYPVLGQSADDVTGLSRGIEDLLKELPSELLGTYQAQYQKCLKDLDSGGAIGLVTGSKCLYDLYQTLKDLIKNKPAAKPVGVPLPAPATSFPILPVALVAVGGIALVYALTKV